MSENVITNQTQSIDSLSDRVQADIDRMSAAWLKMVAAGFQKVDKALDVAVARQQAQTAIALKLVELQSQKVMLTHLLAMERPLIHELENEASPEVRSVLRLQLEVLREQRREVMKSVGVPEEVVIEHQRALPAPDGKKKKKRTKDGRIIVTEHVRRQALNGKN